MNVITALQLKAAAVLFLWLAGVAQAADPRAPSQPAEDRARMVQGLSFHVSARTPEQIMAFYSARGFPEAAVDEIARSCFLTVGIQNKRDDVVWLEPSRWRFVDEKGKPIHRISRMEWEAKWKRLQLPAANRATFGWTQLPVQRDLQPGEPVGANVAIVPPEGRFSLIAEFDTGADRRGEKIVVRVDSLACPRGENE